MALHFVGIGLATPQDITCRGLQRVRNADLVYLESYTSKLHCDIKELEAYYDVPITIAKRNLLEQDSEELLGPAKAEDVVVLVIGDVFSATTHSVLYLEAKQRGIPVTITHNASIINAATQTGLQLYKFGKTTSIVFDDDGWLPNTPYNAIKNNQSIGLHTLCLLDIKTSEPTKEDLLKGRKAEPRPPRYMDIPKAIQILEKLERNHNENIITPNTTLVGLQSIGHPKQRIVTGTPEKLKKQIYNAYPQSLIVPGNLDHIEKQILTTYQI